MIEEIRKNWWWVGINPIDVVCENEFGNLLIKDAEGKFWRLCPEELYCKVIAQNRVELDELNHDQEFLHDWYMKSMVERAEAELGTLPEGKKYCLKIPAVLGGEYDIPNFGVCSLTELIAFSGYLAKEIKDLPDGAKIKFKPIA